MNHHFVSIEIFCTLRKTFVEKKQWKNNDSKLLHESFLRASYVTYKENDSNAIAFN
jgi:hypothetical protein